MSWLFSQALVAEYSAACCSDGEQCAPLSATPTPQAYCSPDKMTECLRLSRFGMTFAHLTADRGEALLTWFLAGFPARTSASPERAQASTESAADCGAKWPASLARFDHGSRSWKTAQLCLFVDSSECLATWPRWGIACGGECWELTGSEPPNIVSEFGYWQTPTTRDGKGQSGKGNREKRGRNGKPHVANLCDQIVDCGRPDLVRSIPFRYSLMGWPQGWTGFAPLETDRFPAWLLAHGAC